MRNPVTVTAAAPSEVAIRHFTAAFTFETDCWETHEALRGGDPGFVLLDAPGTLFVACCAGPHCNGAARALRVAQLGYPVKLMAGGITGWLDEGFTLEAGFS